MKIVVVFKWARDPEDAAVRSDGSVDWRGAKMAPGEDDAAAVAAGRVVAAASGCSVVGLTIGDGDASWALARGIERAVAVPDAPSLADNAATAGLLAAAIGWIGEVGMVVIGDAEAYPGVPAALAGALGWPAVLGVSAVTFAEGRLVATRRMGGGEQTLSLGLPAVLAVAAASAEKHAPGMKAILAARRRPVTAVSLADLGIGPLDGLESRGTRAPAAASARIFEGSPLSTARQLVAALRTDGVLLGRGIGMPRTRTNEMTVEGWVLATGMRRLGGMVAAVRGMGAAVTVAAVGPRSVAEAAAAAGPDAVAWIEAAEGVPAEAYASALGRAAAAAKPRAVLATTAPQDRALLGAAAVALGAVVIPRILRISLDDDAVVVDRTDLGSRVVETLACATSVAGLFGGEDIPPSKAATPAPIERLDVGSPADIRIEAVEPVSGANVGVTNAERVVAVGRGLKAKADLALVEGLATALGAEIGCSMPIADDRGWVARERYIGRSGQHISPRLYVAIGISGAPQHLDGARDAKAVVAINTDPGAPIFRRADYGIVGDLYEVIPAIEAALGEDQSEDSRKGISHE